MKQGLSRKLAIGNIRKNKRFFIPRILTEIGLLSCFYIIYTLAWDDRLAQVKGGNYLPMFMVMGAVIIGLLSVILMMYTNSFLMKQRKREFGLYSVLGMEKKHICRILFFESLFCSMTAVLLGLLGGMLFYKLSALAICKLLQTEVIVGFYFITPKTILPAGAIFLAIDACTFANNCVRIYRLKPIDLLSSTHTGEKEPKVKWVLLVLGVLCLCGGYLISIMVESPLEAILIFFLAVLLVIFGTYFLYIAGSIFVLKALKKNEHYYYRPGHFTAVSGLLYRMKQNAVGLASVAILATGVLVMISSTFCLYSKAEDVLNAQYPQDYYLSTVLYDEKDQPVYISREMTEQAIKDAAEKNGLVIQESAFQMYFDATFVCQEDKLSAEQQAFYDDPDIFRKLCYMTFMTESSYVNLGGQALGLQGNQVALKSFDGNNIIPDTFSLMDQTYSVSKKITFFPITSAMVSVNHYGMVVANEAVFNRIFEGQKALYGENASELSNRYAVSFSDRKHALEKGERFAADVDLNLREQMHQAGYGNLSAADSKSIWEARESIYGMYGTLLFLGILLGLVCLFATVLVIYYKQISEGYEDRHRFQIMQKIGMTDAEVRNTIRSQIMMVFFLPLMTAGIHVAFAYPILTRLMKVLMLDSAWRFAKWCIIVYAVFALIYALIYKLTAKVYYKIVY